jgi:hypothetical protein
MSNFFYYGTISCFFQKGPNSEQTSFLEANIFYLELSFNRLSLCLKQIVTDRVYTFEILPDLLANLYVLFIKGTS